MAGCSRSRRISSTLMVALILLAIPAAAQTLAQRYPSYPTPVTFKDQITVTATGVATETDEVPAPTTVISREELDDSQHTSVSEILRRVPGVTIMRSGNEGKATSVFTRGTNSNQTLVLLDGVRLTSPYFGGYDLSLLSLSGIDRVEVARGPYSALWGADAIGGVINAIPRTGGRGFSVNLFGEAGGNGWRRLDGDLSLGSEHFNIYLAGLHREGDGELENDAFDIQQGLTNLGWSWGKGSRIALVAQTVEADTGIPFVIHGTPSLDRRQRSEQRLVAVPFRWALSETWHLQLTASDVTRTFTFTDPEDPWELTETETDADTREARLASHHFLGAHTLTWGGAWREDEVTDVSNFGPNLQSETDQVISGFIQDVWQAGEKVQLILGARWDDTDSWGSELSPRVHLGWQLSPNVELRTGYGEAFRQPSLGELYYPFSGNPELQPERSRSYEIGLLSRTTNGRSRWQLNVFGTELDNLIEFDFASYTNQNIGSATIMGAELAVDGALTNELSQRIQITWLDTEDDEGRTLLRRPPWSGAYTLTGSFLKGVRGDLTLVYTGSRWDVDPTTFERVEVGGFATVDLAVGWQVTKGIQLTFRTVNLLDRDYEEVRGYPSVGRRLMGGLRLNL